MTDEAFEAPHGQATGTKRLTCGGCRNTWSGQSRAHCSGCHRTFSGYLLFDRHRSAIGEHGACLDPEAITNIQTGERVMSLRSGIWSGPEMSAEQKIRFMPLDLSGCDWYRGVGTCTNNCTDEPRCQTEEPMNGWPATRSKRAGDVA
jgi:hypothetical protein